MSADKERCDPNDRLAVQLETKCWPIITYKTGEDRCFVTNSVGLSVGCVYVLTRPSNEVISVSCEKVLPRVAVSVLRGDAFRCVVVVCG